jgi:glycosyltransferase involved in cell wall biosynthesis
MTILVSVVVPTFKRPELLQRCVAALLAQNFEPSTYEIIIADDAASGETQRLVECWAERGRRYGVIVRYVAVTGRHGPAAARNAGWRAARGSIIAFTDDDCVPTQNWLHAGVSAFTNGVVGVEGRVIMPLPPIPTDYQRDATGLERSEFVTANCFYRREALTVVGGFDERFTAPWREDSDLFFTLLECTGEYNSRSSLVSVAEAIVVHPIRSAPWGVSLYQQRKSMFNALLYKKHPLLYRQRIQPTPPWHYYCIVFTLLAALAGITCRRQRLALGAISTWLMLTGYFCAQRLQQTSHAPCHLIEMAMTSALIPPLAIFWRIWGALKFRVFFL